MNLKFEWIEHERTPVFRKKALLIPHYAWESASVNGLSENAVNVAIKANWKADFCATYGTRKPHKTGFMK